MNDTPAAGEPWGWCVITSEGFRAVFIDRATAEKYAGNTHGLLVPLYPPP